MRLNSGFRLSFNIFWTWVYWFLDCRFRDLGFIYCGFGLCMVVALGSFLPWAFVFAWVRVLMES